MLSVARGQILCRIEGATSARRLLQPRCKRYFASPVQGKTPARNAARRTADSDSLQRSKTTSTTTPKSQSTRNPQSPSQSHSPLSPASSAHTTAASTAIPTTRVKPATPAQAREHGKQNPAPLEHKSERMAYPERLLIYHAGTGRTIFLSCTKLSGIFLFIFTGVFIAPAYYFSPMEPTYLAFVYLAGSCIPLALMTFTAAPFVTYVHLALPAWARHSAARLQRYTQNLPSSAEVDVTSLRWIWPRVSRMNASELYLHKGSITGAMTLRREIPKHVQEARNWYSWRPIKKFYVGGKAGTKSAEPWVWQGVLEAIARGFPRSTVERRR